MTLLTRRPDGKQVDVMPASEHTLRMTTSAKLKVAITRLMIEALAKYNPLQGSQMKTSDGPISVAAAHQNAAQAFNDTSIILLFRNSRQRGNQLRNDTTPHRHATPTTVELASNPRLNVGITQQAVLITDGQRTITNRHFCETQNIQVGRIFLHVAGHRNLGRSLNSGPDKKKA